MREQMQGRHPLTLHPKVWNYTDNLLDLSKYRKRFTSWSPSNLSYLASTLNVTRLIRIGGTLENSTFVQIVLQYLHLLSSKVCRNKNQWGTSLDLHLHRGWKSADADADPGSLGLPLQKHHLGSHLKTDVQLIPIRCKGTHQAIGARHMPRLKLFYLGLLNLISKLAFSTVCGLRMKKRSHMFENVDSEMDSNGPR